MGATRITVVIRNPANPQKSREAPLLVDTRAIVGETIIFGEKNTEPISRVTALESVGIEIDPRNQKLKHTPAIRLKLIPTKD